MSRISEALKKVAEERKAQKEERMLQVNKGHLALALEERLKERIYIAKATDDSGIDPRIVAYHDPKAAISEQYRILRTNIQLNNTPRPLKTIVTSSALHKEGKTITAVNLAVTMAQDLDKTVLLVDCDLRGGIIHQLLAINPVQGLSDILVNGTTMLELAFYKTRVDKLTILPRGDIPHNPSELLGSNKMKRLLEELKSKFDYIILDSPPIIPFADASILSSQAGGVIFVVQANRTQRQIVEQAQNSLKHVHAKILGFVLTQTEYYLPLYMYRYYENVQEKRLNYSKAEAEKTE